MDRKSSHTSGKDRSMDTMDLDTLLAKEVGQFGLHQFRTVALTVLAIILASMHTESVFTTARIATRCVIPECENVHDEHKFKPPWISIAIPESNKGSFDQCHRFIAKKIDENETNQCTPEVFDRHAIVKCDKFVYENQNTVVYDFDLACEEWRRTLLSAIPSLMLFISLPFAGFISDLWGRKVTLTVLVFSASCVGLLKHWTVSYNMFVTITAINVFFEGGCFSTAFIFAMESVGPKYRGLCSALVALGMNFGNMILGGVAWTVEYWRSIILCVYIPSFSIIIFWFFYSESVRWYVSKGRYEDAERVIKDMAQVNKRQLSNTALETLKRIIGREHNEKVLKEYEQKEPCLVVQVFRHKTVLVRCIVVPIWWLAFVLIYHGLEANSVYLSGNKYATYISVAAIDIPGFILALLLHNRTGRRPLFSVAFFVCGACQLASLFLPHESVAESLALYLISKCCISVVVQTVYLYTGELFPTQYRQSLVAFCSTIGRIGNVVAQLTPAFEHEARTILYVSLAWLSCLLAFVTPETSGTVLPNTMEEASKLGSACKKK